MNLTQSDYDIILQQFPPIDVCVTLEFCFNASYQFAFTYGSGIFEQSGYDYTQQASKSSLLIDNMPMVDFVFAVQNPAEVEYLS